MPLEIEAKLKLHDESAITQRLLALNASKGPLLHEVNVFFDTPDHALRKSDQGLRVREETQLDGPHRAVIITHKGPRAAGPVKVRPETELRVDNAAQAGELLTALGFARTMSFEKRRQRWTLDGCHIEIDHVPHLGKFLEIEGPDEATVRRVQARLNLAEEPLISESYIALLRHYADEKGIKSNHIAFE